MIAVSEKGRFKRIPLWVVVHCEVVEPPEKVDPRKRTGFLAKPDSSVGGILLRSDESYPLTAWVQLELQIPTGQGFKQMKVMGRVVQKKVIPEKSAFDNGIAIEDIAEEHRKLLDEFVELYQPT